MKNRLILLLVMSSVSSCVADILHGDADLNVSQPRVMIAEPATSISLETKDIDLFLEGRIKEEYYYLDRVASLRDDFNDTYTFFRNKIKLNTYAEHGRRKYGKPASQAEFRLACFNYWDDALKYTEFSEETTYLQENDPHKKIALGAHKHSSVVPLVYLCKAWINLDLDVLYPSMIPTSFKVGYFRYKVGRGISLGSYFEGSVSYLGWQDYTCASNASQSPPGVLFEIEFTKRCALELYYSRLRSRSESPTMTREATRAHLLSLPYKSLDPKDLERGTKGDTDIYSVKLEIDHEDKRGGKWHFQPYLVCVNAPEQIIEKRPVDASARFATSGMMIEVKKGAWQFNAEAAYQFGQQQVLGIDRNGYEAEVSEIAGDRGGISSRHSRLLLEGTQTKAWQDPVLTKVVNNPINRVPGSKYIYTGSNTTGLTKVTQDDGGGAKNVVNADYPFGGLGRFRKEYTISYGGYMALADVAYTRADKRLTISAAGALISGDKYPYNEEVNKSYKGFMPLRDQNYFGQYVRSFAVLYARKMPRPVDMADHKFYAFNNDEDTSNLRYVGIGLQWHPLQDPRKLTILPLWLSFWEDCPPQKWLPLASRDFNGNATYNAVYKQCQKKLNFTGAASTELASRHLGQEVTLCAIWVPMPNCQISGAFSAFIPGQLYKDVEGMPNRNTRRIQPDGCVRYDSLGTQPVFGGSMKISFTW